MMTKPAKRVRCAVYTRVSTEYGLDQEFNSLDAQHEASEAYVRSQAHDGWTLIRTRYDDGGCDEARREEGQGDCQTKAARSGSDGPSSRGIELLGNGHEGDAMGVEQLDQLGEVRQGAGEPVDLVDHNDVDFSPPDLIEKLL